MDILDFFDDIDDVAIEEEAFFVEYLSPRAPKRTRVLRPRPDHFQLDDQEFHRRFRLLKTTTEYLHSLIEEKIKWKTERNQCVSSLMQLLVTLRFYATGTFYETVGDFGGLHSSTICRIIKRVTEAIASLRPQFINMPHTDQEIRKSQEDFFKIAQFPRVVSTIGCCHIKIPSPGVNIAEGFRNSHNFFSINVQALCSANLTFHNIVARWPGSTQDSVIFLNSLVKLDCENGAFGNGVILGDSGYEQSNYLLTPFRDPKTPAQTLYNESHIQTHNCAERCFGAWKRRFPLLSLGLRCKLPLAQDIIVACAVVHNIARNHNEDEPPEDPDVEVAVEPEFPPNVPGNTGVSKTRDDILEYFNSLIPHGNEV